MDPENQNFEKMKKTLEDIIILQMCTINDSHMIYDSWDMEYNGQNLPMEYHGQNLSFWTIFCPPAAPPPSPHNNPKNQSF